MPATRSQRDPRHRDNGPRTPEQIKAQRETRQLVKAAGRAVRKQMEARDFEARRVAASATGAVLSLDRTHEGDFGDGSGFTVSPRRAMRQVDAHAPHVQAIYDAAEQSLKDQE